MHVISSLFVIALVAQGPARSASPAPSPTKAGASIAAAARFAMGAWKNVDKNTSGITRATFRVDADVLVAHMWTRCGPPDCDLGESRVFQSSVARGGFAFTRRHLASNGVTFAVSDLKVAPAPNGRLRISQHEHFIDNSGRPDRDWTDEFSKE